MSIVRLLAGPKAYAVLSANMDMPHAKSVTRKVREVDITFNLGFCDKTWESLAKFYEAQMLAAGIQPGTVLVTMPEDETMITERLDYDQQSDTVFGLCGRECARKCESVQACRKAGLCGDVHQCTVDASQERAIGADDNKTGEAYKQLKEDIEGRRKAKMLRAVMINPLHKGLKSMTCFATGTCNAFDANNYVEIQWEKLEEMYEKHLRKVLGPLVGHGSDGDSRRRHLMARYCLANVKKEEKYGLIHKALTLAGSCTKDAETGQVTSIKDIPDQDYYHVAKKLLNCASHAARTLQLGPRLIVHFNVVTQAMSQFEPMEHGLKGGDDSRKGFRAMDWRSLIRLVRTKFLTVLERLVDGEQGARAPDPAAAGMLQFLKLIRRYVSIFASRKESIRERVVSASYVLTYLRLWRQWTKQQPDLVLKHHFITREAFQDTVLSCHAFLLMCQAHRDIAPGHPATPDRMGSNCVEICWSDLGGWVRNKRVYSMLEARNTLAANQCVQYLAATEGLKLPNNRKRYELDWDDPKSRPASSLQEWLTDAEMKSCVESGVVEAKSDMEHLGMKPPGRLPQWWNEPEEFDDWGKTVKEGGDVSREDSENENDDGSGNGSDGKDDDDDFGGNEGNGSGQSGCSEQGIGDGSSSSGWTDDDMPLSQLVHVAGELQTELLDVVEGSGKKVHPKIWVPRVKANVHKGTVVASFNTGKKISADRSRRYQQLEDDMKHQPKHIALSREEWVVGVGSNICVRESRPVVVQSKAKGKKERVKVTCRPARVLRIRKANAGSFTKPRQWTEYKQPVTLPGAREELIFLQCHYYTQVQQRGERQRFFKYDHADPEQVHASAIVSPVNFNYMPEDDTYEISKESMTLVLKGASGAMDWQPP